MSGGKGWGETAIPIAFAVVSAAPLREPSSARLDALGTHSCQHDAARLCAIMLNAKPRRLRSGARLAPNTSADTAATLSLKHVTALS